MATKTKDKKHVPAKREAQTHSAMPAEYSSKLMGTAHDPSSFVPKRLVTVPQLKLAEGVTTYWRILRAFYDGREIETVDADGGVKKPSMLPPKLVDIINLETGMPCVVVVNHIVRSEIERAYPDAGYIGKCFAVKMLGKVPGKRYKGCEVAEIEDPDAPEQNAA